jgi:anti-sigma B factor antagonist
MRAHAFGHDPAPGSAAGMDQGVGPALTTGTPPHASDALCLIGDLTISRATELKSTILASLERTGSDHTIRLDLAQVTDLDSSGVQLLLLVRHLAAARNCTLELSACSPVVRQVLGLMHLTTLIGSPSLRDASGSAP